MNDAYQADWRPSDTSPEANEQRKRIPMEIRRLYYTMDQMDDTQKQELFEWIDEYNLLPQVRNEQDSDGLRHSSFDSLA